jgi:hypothetical protein
LKRVARRRIFIIDLHRHPVAYYFYRTVGRLFLHNRLIKEDGALSILRSFKPQELINLASQAGLEDVSVERRFPYRLVLSARANWIDIHGARWETNNERPLLGAQADHRDHAENIGVAR